MKKLITLITLLGSLTFCFGQADTIYVTNNMAVGIATISTQPGILTSLTAYSTNTSPTIVLLYDGYYLATNVTWTNYTTYTTNVVTSYVTTTGITNNLTNLVIKTVANPHAAVAGTVNTPFATLVVPAASSSGTITPIVFNDDFLFGKRLSFSNGATGLTLIGHYRNQ